jgi:DNA (cytosine-5)-methyltransferase 1
VPEYADSASADLIRRRLGRWGYELHEEVVEGLAWSLENRRRWILVAVTEGLVLDLGQLLQETGDRPATLGEVLDEVPLDDPSWRTFAHLARKETRDLAKGNGFVQQLVDPSSTRVPTMRRGYQKGGSTDPRLVHPSRPGYSRLLTPAEHARIKGIPPVLVEGLSAKRAHQVLGQSVIAPKFVAIGQLLGEAVAA